MNAANRKDDFRLGRLSSQADSARPPDWHAVSLSWRGMEQAGKTGKETPPEATDVGKVDNRSAREVRILWEHGVETAELSAGGPGHSHFEPAVRFAGGQTEGFRALEIARQNGLKATELRQVWTIKNGEPIGPQWEMVFIIPKPQKPMWPGNRMERLTERIGRSDTRPTRKKTGIIL